MNALRYYIKADSHSGFTKSLQSFYESLMKERQCSLKTKQCNKKSCTHDFKPDVGFCVRYADAGYKQNKICAKHNLKFHYMDNFESQSRSSTFHPWSDSWTAVKWVSGHPRNEPVGRSWLVNVQTNIFIGEFDPGSGRTLAACLTHASRTGRSDSLLLWSLVANGWVTRRQPALQMGTTPRKGC